MIEIVPFISRWHDQFCDIAGRLRAGLGALALRIDHIGSTAVPGLAAKDVIDIQIAVADFSGELLERLTALGYDRAVDINRDHRPPGDDAPADHWQKWFFRPPPGQRPTNTHVRIVGHANQQYALLFRDYLRAHPATAAAYAELKQQLARELRDPSQYPDVKDPAVDLIYLAARDWAAVNAWQPGRSDA
jgi:GrpB-like predicted nucleotidyltransferase (UPF0157 family)